MYEHTQSICERNDLVCEHNDSMHEKTDVTIKYVTRVNKKGALAKITSHDGRHAMRMTGSYVPMKYETLILFSKLDKCFRDAVDPLFFSMLQTKQFLESPELYIG